MKSFFEKFGSINDELNYYFKYNLELPSKNDFYISLITGKFILKYYKNRLVETLEKSKLFNIEGDNLRCLPDNVKSDNLRLAISYYNMAYDLPKNWNIDVLDFHKSDYYPTLKDTFKSNKVSLTFHQIINQ